MHKKIKSRRFKVTQTAAIEATLTLPSYLFPPYIYSKVRFFPVTTFLLMLPFQPVRHEN